MLVAPESSPGAPWGTLGSKNIRTSEAAPVKRGDRQPEQQTLVVPQRQCLRLVVYLPVQWPLPPARGTMACPYIVAHITKSDTWFRCERILVFYSPKCVEGLFSELRPWGSRKSAPEKKGCRSNPAPFLSTVWPWSPIGRCQH